MVDRYVHLFRELGSRRPVAAAGSPVQERRG